MIYFFNCKSRSGAAHHPKKGKMPSVPLRKLSLVNNNPTLGEKEKKK